MKTANPDYSSLKGVETIDGSLQAVFNRTRPTMALVVKSDGSSTRRLVSREHYTRLELVRLIADVEKDGGDVTLLRQGLTALATSKATATPK